MAVATNTATLPDTQTQNARNMSEERETIDQMRAVVFTVCDVEPDFYVPVDARFYRARKADGSSPVYCSVWIRTRDGRYFSGRGKATGYGYHKKSAALQAALESAGVKLAVAIDGVGESAMKEALLAIVNAAGFEGVPVTTL